MKKNQKIKLTKIILILLVILSGCKSKADNHIDQSSEKQREQNSTNGVENKISTSVKISETDKVFDYMQFDSVLINCDFTYRIHKDSLVGKIGQPDTIIYYNDEMEFIGKPYSYMKYKAINFHLYDNGISYFESMHLIDSSYSICYKEYRFDSKTTLDDLSKIFPFSFKKRDNISVNN